MFRHALYFLTSCVPIYEQSPGQLLARDWFYCLSKVLGKISRGREPWRLTNMFYSVQPRSYTNNVCWSFLPSAFEKSPLKFIYLLAVWDNNNLFLYRKISNLFFGKFKGDESCCRSTQHASGWHHDKWTKSRLRCGCGWIPRNPTHGGGTNPEKNNYNSKPSLKISPRRQILIYHGSLG